MEKNAVSRVAVASRSFSKHPLLRHELLARYEQVTFNETGQSLSGEALVQFLSGHDKAITALERIDEALLARLPDLTVIGKYGVGLDMIDMEALSRHQVRLGWTGGVNRRSVAELVVSAAIALLHRTPESHVEVKDGVWRQLQGRQLTGKTVGIIGCGHIGKDVAILMRAFDCKILAHDIEEFPDFYAQWGVVPVELDELLSQSDVVTVHLPLIASTQNMMNAARLNAMKQGACFINIARGGIVDETELKKLLMNGHLCGAALDVFAEEPPTDMALLNLSNVIVTGHIGGSTQEAVLAMGRAAIEGLDVAQVPAMA